MDTTTNHENERIISVLNLCRYLLYMNDILTTEESVDIGSRIRTLAKDLGVELTCDIASRAQVTYMDHIYQIEQ